MAEPNIFFSFSQSLGPIEVEHWEGLGLSTLWKNGKITAPYCPGRGMALNSSARGRNNFGVNKEPLFPKNKNEKGEKVNWTASFTRGGCVACRDDKDGLNHSGRTGTPIVLLIGDEAMPPVCGYTRKGDEESGCTWVFKKEHLALQEVPGILRRLNMDKQEYDRQQTAEKASRVFFIPNGSKILVSSYVNL